MCVTTRAFDFYLVECTDFDGRTEDHTFTEREDAIGCAKDAEFDCKWVRIECMGVVHRAGRWEYTTIAPEYRNCAYCLGCTALNDSPNCVDCDDYILATATR